MDRELGVRVNKINMYEVKEMAMRCLWLLCLIVICGAWGQVASAESFRVDVPVDKFRNTVGDLAVGESSGIMNWHFCRDGEALYVPSLARAVATDVPTFNYVIKRLPNNRARLEVAEPEFDALKTRRFVNQGLSLLAMGSCSDIRDKYSYAELEFYRVTEISGEKTLSQLRTRLMTRYVD
jgi:hypothetical protein